MINRFIGKRTSVARRGKIFIAASGLDKNKSVQSKIWNSKIQDSGRIDPAPSTLQDRKSYRLIRTADFKNNALVLDIGCFTGEKIFHLDREKVKTVIGIDIAQSALIRAQMADPYPDVFLKADLENLPLRNSVADGVLCFDVIEHLSSLEKGISEISRVLKPGGRVILHFPVKNNAFSLFWLKQKLFPEIAEKDFDSVGHSPDRIPDSRRVEVLLNKYGVVVEKKIFFNSFWVHLFDREILPFLAKIILNLASDGTPAKATHSSGQSRPSLFKKALTRLIIPAFSFLEFLDYPHRLLNIGNTCYFIAVKAFKDHLRRKTINTAELKKQNRKRN